MSISVVNHCIPAYDELSRIGKVQQLPPDILEMEQQTAGGLLLKLKAVLHSDYLKQLPKFATIQSGGNKSYFWKKSDFIESAERILSETKN